MNPPVLVDTSVVSWYLSRNARTEYPRLVEWLDEVITRDGLHISAVTLYEIRRGVGELRARGQVHVGDSECGYKSGIRPARRHG